MRCPFLQEGLSGMLDDGIAMAYNATMWKIIGHRQTLAFFAHVRERGHLSHAYLLTGPAQVGKRTLAQAFAQALLCTAERTSPPGSPCGECRSCLKALNGTHPDLHTILPTEGKKAPGIDEIRALIAAAALQPQEGQYSIFVLPHAERLTAEAANALLKTLEEPAPHTLLLLTATDEQLLPNTIVSRCQILPLTLVTPRDISAALIAHWGISNELAQELSWLSAGRPGWAIAASQNPELREQRVEWFQLMDSLCASGPAQRMQIAAKLAQDPGQLDELFVIWLSWWRDVLLTLEGAQLPGKSPGGALPQYVRQIRPDVARQVIKQIHEAAQQIEQNAPPRLVLETLVLELPQIKEASTAI